MRFVVIIGVALLLSFVVFQFVPLASQPVNPISASGSTPFEIFSVGGFSISGSIPVLISWSASSPVTFVAATCPNACRNVNVNELKGITELSGTSGSFTLEQPNGGGIVLVALNQYGGSPVVSLSVFTGLATEAAVCLFVGIAVCILGVVWRPKGRPVRAPESFPAPLSPETAPAPPTPPPSAKVA